MGGSSPRPINRGRGLPRRSRAWGGLWVWIVLVLAAAGQLPAAGSTARSNTVPGIKSFALDDDAGAMALHTLAICFEAYGHWSTYSRVVAQSGSAFKVVYDTTEAYEPLRDLYPTDVLKTTATTTGFPDAHWLLDEPIARIKETVKKEIDDGHPLIAPYLKTDAYRGFVAIVGYDYDADVFLVQGALRDSVYARVPIPKQWSGPTASPMGWATNPVFVIGGIDQDLAGDLGQDKALLANGVSMLAGGTLEYGLHPGEKPYMPGGPSRAVFGIPAYRLLSLDVEKAPLVVTRAGKDSVNFGLIWRLDSQLGQLEHDRRYAAQTLNYIVSRVSGGKSVEAGELVTNVERTAADVRALRKVFLDPVPYGLSTADAVAAYVDASPSMVFSIAGRDRLLQELIGRGYQAFKTRWGPLVVADSPEKRLEAKLAVKSIESRERLSKRMMEDLVEYVGADLGVPPQEPTGPAKRRTR